MMDEWQYASLLSTATRKTLQCLDAALQGKDSQESVAAPFKLAPDDLRQVRAHAKAIAYTVATARLVPVKVRAQRER